MELAPEVVIRAAKDSDLNLILTSWLKGAYYGSWMREVDKTTFFKLYPSVIKDILRRCGLNVVIAHYSDSPDVVLGWAALEPAGRILHFMYVKPEYRKQGIMSKLLTGYDVQTVTHITKPGLSIAREKGWQFNPFVA